MSVINKIPRGLRVLIVIIILAVLVWRFAFDTEYFYYSLGLAALITIGVILLIYLNPSKSSTSKTSKPDSISRAEDNSGELSETDNTSMESNELESNSIANQKSDLKYKSVAQKPLATDVAARYMQMAQMANQESDSIGTNPTIKNGAPASVNDEENNEPVEASTDSDDSSDEPPIPLIEDETTLTEEEKNELVNAVWYRCENPYCKYTRFLGVHHIIDEKNGGTNKLDNLIVLCPFCHDLAHRNEIPETEMKDWISNREERFKFKPQWHHF